MKLILGVLSLFFFISAYATEFEFPDNMSADSARKIVEYFGVGFVGRAPMSLINQGDHQTQVSLGWNMIDTKKLSKLGSGTEDKPVQYQELHFSKVLPYDVELGLQSNLLILDNDLSTFGGFFRWSFVKNPYWGLSLLGHGASANFKSEMGINLYGGLLSVDIDLKRILISIGTGQLRTTTTFQPQVFGGTGTSVRVAKHFPHQCVRVTYNSGRWNLSGQNDWIKDFHSSVMLGYLF